MRTPHEEVLDDLDGLVAGDRDVIARHAEHLASCDACRDARHDASQLAAQLRRAGDDHVPQANLEDVLLAKLADVERGPVESTPAAKPVEATVAAKPVDATPTAKPVEATASTKPVDSKRAERTPAAPLAPAPVRAMSSARKRTMVYVAGAMAALAAGTVGIVLVKKSNDTPNARHAETERGGAIGAVKTIARAAASQGEGLAIKDGTGWRALAEGEQLPAGAELRTDERTRGSLEMRDGTRIVLDHRTSLVFDANEPRRIALHAGRIATDVAHVEKRPAVVTTSTARIDVIGTRFSVTAGDSITAVQVVRGSVIVDDGKGQRDEVRAGEEGVLEGGKLAISSTPTLAKEAAWSELSPVTKPTDDNVTSGLGALRAYKPGEKRDRDWKLALANHEVKVRIVGPVARTEITETFRNDSDTTLEGVYQFPLPADAQIDSLSLDMENEPGGFIHGAFVDKERAAKIWRGVIDKATPKITRDPLIQQEIVWVPGPWRDPALLDWKRGGRFELRIYPIPAKGARTIKLAYTQIVTPRGTTRQYVYPLPHSTDGSTVADKMKVDIEVRGAAQGSVRTVGYDMKADPARTDVSALSLEQGAFVPRGDLVVDYKPDTAAELRAWTFTGGAAVGPDDKLAAKKGVGIDPKVIDAQRLVAGDARPTAILALSPKLPRWRESKARDYVIVVDGSQSMVGERYTRASELAVALVDDMDRRDRFGVLVCDSDCARMSALRAPSTGAATEVKAWLGAQIPAGASDLVGALRAGNDELTKAGDMQRERWVIFVGDGFATTGFRRVSDVERAIASTTQTSNVHISTIGIGGDADAAVLAAAARGGGGSYVPWLPGQTVGVAAMAALESTYGASLRDATVELPAGLVDVAAAGGAIPTASEKPIFAHIGGATGMLATLPTLRAGGEVLIAARVAGDVKGEVVLRGKVAGQPFEQRYPLSLAVSTAAGNAFVPRLWASLAIDQLERQGRGEDRARIVAMSQGYGVMSRETSLLVLESQAMFDAFGIDRGQPAATWTGEDDIDEVATSGVLEVPADTARSVAPKAEASAPSAVTKRARDELDSAAMDEGGGGAGKGFGGGERASRPAPSMRPPPRGRAMIPMKKVWTRHASLAAFGGVDASITKAITNADDALVKSPDSREKHRALVQALSYAGELDRARDIANRWLQRDKLDPQALGYVADLLGRDGKRDLALRTLAGLVDLDADRAALHERMVNAYERTGRIAQACSHRIALASLTVKEAAPRAGAAARCLRSLGRTSDADLVIAALVDDNARTQAEKAATVSPIPPRVAGDLVITGKWDSTADLDITLVAPDGTRVSWMGGRTDITVADATSGDREQLAVRRLKKGNYLIEINRADAGSGTIRGSLDVTVLGKKQAFPFELPGSRVVVGKIAVTMQSHLEPLNPGDARFLGPGFRGNPFE